MSVLPIETLINESDTLFEQCNKSDEPIYLGSGGKPELVVMSLRTYDKLRLKQRLLDIELEQLSGGQEHRLDELDDSLKKLVS